MIGGAVEALLVYAVQQGLIDAADVPYARNRVLDVLRVDDYEPAAVPQKPVADLEAVLASLLDDAAVRGVIAADTGTFRDLLDTAIMGCLVAPPADVIGAFEADYALDPVRATDNFHRMGVASNYIRMSRTDRNIVWDQQTRYGPMTMTINVSKPEKDPRDIAAAADDPREQAYPLCLLCRENEGYAGNPHHPARQNLRLIPVELQDETWFLQYSPYQYFNEHCIVLSEEHRPMRISAETFARLAQFTTWLPHYLVGSNADLPIVGGSILSHDHFQGGRHEFPIERAATLLAVQRDDVSVSVLDWPLAVLRIEGPDDAVIAFCTRVLEAWRGYDDPGRSVLSHTGDTPHNSITPIARRTGGRLRIDLVLRNNRTDADHPDGIFHPHAGIHPVKKENIGLIEAMGLAILPARLAPALEAIAAAYSDQSELAAPYAAFQPVLDGLRELGPASSIGQAQMRTRHAVGEYFVRGLQHCGVFGDQNLEGCQDFLAVV